MDQQTSQNSIQELVFKYMLQMNLNVSEADYQKLDKHIESCELLSRLSHSSIMIFDYHQKKTVYFSKNYGYFLGYELNDFEAVNYKFFEDRIRPEDKHNLAILGLSSLKIFNGFSKDEKLNHKVVYEFRMENSENKYVRLIDQYQILELDNSGQAWLVMSVLDVSPNQEIEKEVQSQILNFRTGEFTDHIVESSQSIDLTKREIEILKLVKEGFMSKEIADKLYISVHTVNTHRQRFLEKLGAQNSMEAIAFASKFGFLS